LNIIITCDIGEAAGIGTVNVPGIADTILCGDGVVTRTTADGRHAAAHHMEFIIARAAFEILHIREVGDTGHIARIAAGDIPGIAGVIGSQCIIAAAAIDRASDTAAS
jgi:hypothetical protein